MKEQQIVSVAGYESDVSVQRSVQIREPIRSKRRGLVEAGMIGDLVAKPMTALVKSVLPPEMQEALGIRDTSKQEKKPPIIIVVNPGNTPETTTGSTGTVSQPVMPRTQDRPLMSARQLPGASASVSERTHSH